MPRNAATLTATGVAMLLGFAGCGESEGSTMPEFDCSAVRFAFLLSLDPTQLTLAPSGAVSTAVNVQADLGGGTVTLSVEGLPSGATAAVSPASLAVSVSGSGPTEGTAQVTLTNVGAAEGSYPITVRGTPNSTECNSVRTAPLTLDVTGAAAQWRAVNTGYSSTLRAVHFPTATNGFAAGDDGVIKTEDGGETWTDGGLGGDAVTSIHFIDENVGLAVNTLGEVWRAAFGGPGWSGSGTPITAGGPLRAVQMVDENVAYAGGVMDASGVGGGLWETDDGGQTWDEVPGPFSQAGGREINAIFFSAPGVGVVGTENATHYTADGGATWTTQSVTRVHSMSFTDAQNGVLTTGSGVNTYYRTSDGGATWSTVPMPGPAHGYFGIHLRGDAVTKVGSGGVIRRSQDAGANWDVENEFLSGNPTLWAVTFFSDSEGIAVGENGVALKRQ